ncbi:hypothetical protein [Gottfriedia solisilvae]|uniref:Uncharacterized protein n=1 Tax=Gottfriedia solisilvae TaxID=1516104 RepID=A0A8J3AEV1_9BACI|nr:hypothetical protein [Gottfriedia solisilvae]GGI11514.1 hypothetical protein GCM10007380_08220 [Gottfriedia solisilvae]
MTLREVEQEVKKLIKDIKLYDLQAIIEENNDNQPEDEDGFIYHVKVHLYVDGKLQESYYLESLEDEFVAKLRLKHVQSKISKW